MKDTVPGHSVKRRFWEVHAVPSPGGQGHFDEGLTGTCTIVDGGKLQLAVGAFGYPNVDVDVGHGREVGGCDFRALIVQVGILHHEVARPRIKVGIDHSGLSPAGVVVGGDVGIGTAVDGSHVSCIQCGVCSIVNGSGQRGAGGLALQGIAIEGERIKFDGAARKLELDRAVKAHTGHCNGIAAQGEGLGIAVEPVAIGYGLGYAVVGAAIRERGDVHDHRLCGCAVAAVRRGQGQGVGPSGVGPVRKQAAIAQRSSVCRGKAIRLRFTIDAQGIKRDVATGELDFHGSIKGHRRNGGAVGSNAQSLSVAEKGAAVGRCLEDTVVGTSIGKGRNVDFKRLGTGTSCIGCSSEGEDMGPCIIRSRSKLTAVSNVDLCCQA